LTLFSDTAHANKVIFYLADCLWNSSRTYGNVLHSRLDVAPRTLPQGPSQMLIVGVHFKFYKIMKL